MPRRARKTDSSHAPPKQVAFRGVVAPFPKGLRFQPPVRPSWQAGDTQNHQCQPIIQEPGSNPIRRAQARLRGGHGRYLQLSKYAISMAQNDSAVWEPTKEVGSALQGAIAVASEFSVQPNGVGISRRVEGAGF